jgi:hypothetical protein
MSYLPQSRKFANCSRWPFGTDLERNYKTTSRFPSGDHAPEEQAQSGSFIAWSAPEPSASITKIS